LATLDTQDTARRQTKHKTQHRRPKGWATRSPPNIRGWIQVITKGKQFLLLIRYPSSYMYIVKSDASLVGGRGKKTSTSNGKDPLS